MLEVKTILFPSSYYDGMRVDEDLTNEYEAALAIGLWDIIFFNYDKWFNEGRIVLSKSIDDKIVAVHRGWMMKTEQYRSFYAALMERNIILITDMKEYENFHYFPNVYADIRTDTPRMIAFPPSAEINLKMVKSNFDRFMVKDYVKSVKGTEFPKFFTCDITDHDFENAMKIFYKYRGNMASGGLCFKEYVDLKIYGDRTNEYRVFYINNEIASICRNSLQPAYTPEPPVEMIKKYRNLQSRFYTLDYAELANGSWMILEAGDGGVSGPSEGQNLEVFYRAMYHCINR